MDAKGTWRSYVRQEKNSSVRYPCGNLAGIQQNQKSNAKGIWTPYGKNGTNLAIKHPQGSRNQVQTNPPYQSLEIWNLRACHGVNRTHNVGSIYYGFLMTPRLQRPVPLNFQFRVNSIRTMPGGCLLLAVFAPPCFRATCSDFAERNATVPL